jgi:hypothetical protein
MPFFPDEVVEQILLFVSSHHDRNAVSLVCHAWHHIERLTRRSVSVCNCYAVRPERVHVRFPCLRSLSVKGKPHFADFNLVPAGWGATADPWVDACVRACPGLEELRLKRMVVTDDCLKHLAHSFLKLKSLVLVSCEGFSTDGLAAIATNCRWVQALRISCYDNIITECASLQIGLEYTMGFVYFDKIQFIFNLLSLCNLWRYSMILYQVIKTCLSLYNW